MDEQMIEKLRRHAIAMERPDYPSAGRFFSEVADELERLAAEVDLQDKEIVHLHNLLTPDQMEAELNRAVDIKAVSRRVQRCMDRARREKEAARG